MQESGAPKVRLMFQDEAGFGRINKQVGCSPQQYLNRCRMENAASMLLDQHMRPGEVARAVGYPDEFSFSRAFRKHYGIFPSDTISHLKYRYNPLSACDAFDDCRGQFFDYKT